MPTSAMIAPTLMMTVPEVERHPASGETIDNGNDQKQHQLLAINQTLLGVRRAQRRNQRGRAIRRQQPEHRRRLHALVMDGDDRGPARDGDRQHDAGRGDRHLCGGDESEEGAYRSDLELVTPEQRCVERGSRHHIGPRLRAARQSARSAA